jgi:hypothetical protein
MTQGRKLTIEKRLQALEERLQALGSQPARQGGYMTSAGLTMPAPPPKHRGSSWNLFQILR